MQQAPLCAPRLQKGCVRHRLCTQVWLNMRIHVLVASVHALHGETRAHHNSFRYWKNRYRLSASSGRGARAHATAL